MLDTKLLKENFSEIREKLLTRHAEGEAYKTLAELLDEFVVIDEKRRALITETEALQQDRNTFSKEIGTKKRAGENADELQQKVQTIKQKLEISGSELDKTQKNLDSIALRIPNIPDESVPAGKGENDNVEIRKIGDPKNFEFEPKQHFELAEALGILDLERAAKLAGSRFSLLSGMGARLERALVDFMLDIQTGENNYTEFAPPYIVNANTMRGTGQLPKFEEDLFRLQTDNPMYLIPTAEVPLTNIHSGEILEEKELPKLYTAYTPCFRSEAGSYGKDTRGIIRVHQFNKVELVNIVAQEASNDALEKMTNCAEEILKRLEIPYRVVVLCSADMGFSAAKTYDIEAWLPGQNTYREISSCSNCKDFQGRRANIRYRPADGGKPKFAHTLNGSGMAVGRTWIAILENYQQADGSVLIPEALRPYMGGVEVIGNR